MEAAERDIRVATGIDLHIRETTGPARPFLLVHGLASNARLWDGVAAALTALGHPVVTVDLRGHGRSSKPDSGYGVAAVARDLHQLLDRIGCSGAVVAGQSWGGNVVLELAHQWPDAVSGIVCVDGGWIELSRRFDDWEACRTALTPPRLMGTPVDDLSHTFREMHPDWPEAGIEGALANFEVRADHTVAPWLTLDRHLLALRGLWAHHPSKIYADISVPVLLVPADDGTPWSQSKRHDVAAAAAALPKSRTQWFIGDHDIHAQHPIELAALLAGEVADGFFE